MRKKKEVNMLAITIGGLALAGLAFGLRRAVVQVGGSLRDDNLQGDDAVKAGLRDVMDAYGENYAREIEQLLRWESAHFKSLQWIEGNTAGMEATTQVFPYGWTSLLEWATVMNIPPSKFSTFTMTENNTGVLKRFVRFPNIRSFINFVAWFIKNKRGGRIGNWYALNDTLASNYANAIAGVIPRFVNAM